MLDVKALQRLYSTLWLRSTSSFLIVGCTQLFTVGDCIFPVAAASVWNSLPKCTSSVTFSQFPSPVLTVQCPCKDTLSLWTLYLFLLLTFLLDWNRLRSMEIGTESESVPRLVCYLAFSEMNDLRGRMQQRQTWERFTCICNVMCRYWSYCVGTEAIQLVLAQHNGHNINSYTAPNIYMCRYWSYSASTSTS